MLILTEATPNPNARRFLVERPISDCAREYRVGDTGVPPAAARLLAIEGVAKVLVGSDFVTASRAPDAREWAELSAVIIVEIATSLECGEAWVVVGTTIPAQRRDGDSLIEDQIGEVLAKHVAPQVARDGGDIEFLDFDPASGTVRVALKGACGGCPSAAMTLKNGVETILKRYVPEVRAVQAEARAGETREPFWRKWLSAAKAA